MVIFAIVASRLQRSGVARHAIESEARAMRPAVVAPTVDRSVLGIMVDFAMAVRHYSGDLRKDEELIALEDWLAETPCHAALSGDRVVFPNRKAPDLLRVKWADRPLQPSSGVQ